ncbi:MAG TPA: ribosome small subunit-dependent GTPase A [Deferrisomatales bacterium]|nr:ribosome small subunit-dependent GTPase A [Deferrisomatales bacterium]
MSFASRERYRVLTEEEELWALLPGAARLDAASPMPAVGDWVALERAEGDTNRIRRVLPRRTTLGRAQAGERKKGQPTAARQQVMAANVDVAIIVCGLDRDYNPRRIERYVTLAWGGGVEPVILLNKADLCLDAAMKAEEVRALAPGAMVETLSALDGAGIDLVRALVPPGRTACLLGSSGAGKSTILNGLMGGERQRTAETSETTGKGRHTTTHRELLVIPGGGVMIDTPGLREVALIADEEALSAAFGSIQELAQRCRFTDCSHTTEPGCAVLCAVAAGELDADRLESFHRLGREISYHRAVESTSPARVERDKWKSIRKEVRRIYKSR